jgi:PKHD-type hydroxylase
MELSTSYYYFNKGFNKSFCKKIIKNCLSLKGARQKGITFKYDDKKLSKNKLKDLFKLRDSDVVFFDDQLIYNDIFTLVRKANEAAGWNYDFDWCETTQFTIYGKNQHYGWHCDMGPKPYDDSSPVPHRGKIRKLSCSVLLNDPKEFEGGEFEFDLRNNEKGKNIIVAKELERTGSVIVFPSYIWHRVKPVTKGTRYSLVFWFLGPPYR